MSNPTRDVWRRKLRRLHGLLRDDVDAVAGLRSVQAERSAVDSLLDDLAHQLERTEAAAVITLVGATGAGKSTLLNAIAGERIAEEGVDRPTTTRPTIYAPVDAVIDDLVNAAGRTAGAAVAGGANVVRYDPPPNGAAHVLVDAPDVNSVANEHEQTVARLAAHSDVLLVVLHRQSVVEAIPVAFVDELADRRVLAFLVNRCDELTESARDALLAQVRTLASERWNAASAPVAAVSAKRALDDRQGDDRQRILDLIEGMLAGQAIQRIRRHNALGSAKMLAAVFADVEARAGDDLRSLPPTAAAAVESLMHDVADDSTQRWQVRKTDIANLLWTETARHWDGPGGWAMRLGAVDVVGLGAAGALMRTNPMLAAGTAVGAAAASGIAKVAAERRWQDVAALLPDEAEFARSYQKAMADCRIRAGRLYGEGVAPTIPSAEQTYEWVATALSTTWRALVQVDLPQAATRSAGVAIRWLVDLPVYAVVAWLVYEAVNGFLRTEYVGVDLLVNAGLVVGGYLFAVRLAMRGAVRWRARRVLQRAVERCLSELAVWQGEAVESLSSDVGEVSEALSRLQRLDADWLESLDSTSAVVKDRAQKP